MLNLCWLVEQNTKKPEPNIEGNEIEYNYNTLK